MDVKVLQTQYSHLFLMASFELFFFGQTEGKRVTKELSKIHSHSEEVDKGIRELTKSRKIQTLSVV